MRRVLAASVVLLALFLAVGCGVISEDRAEGGGLEGETLTLAGQVVYPDGSPASGTRVSLRTRDFNSGASEGVELVTVAGPDGRYQFTTIPPGDYFLTSQDDLSTASFQEIHLAAPGRADSVVTLAPDTLKTMGSVRGRVAYPAGLTPLPSGAVQMPGLGRLITIDTSGEIRIDDVPPGSYYLRIVYSSLGLNHKVDNVVIKAGDTTDIGQFTLNPPGTEDLAAWPHTLAIRINTTATGANISSTFADFPILFRLDSSNFPFEKVGAPMDGADLRFTDASGKRLDFEIETWNHPARRAQIWVKMDTVYGNRDNQIVNIHFGKPDVFSTTRSQAAFDSAFGHIAVWHFSDYNSGGLLSDATFNKNHLRIGATANASGQVGHGRAIGSGDELAAAGSASLNPASLTLTAWVRPNGAQVETARLFWKERSGSSVPAFSLTWLGKAGALEFAVATTGSRPGTVSARAPLPAGQDWVHVAATFNASTGVGTLFINGKSVQSFEDKSSIEYGVSGDLILGAQSGGSNAFQGVLDEIRISRTARIATRFAIEYENQKPGSKLLVFP